MINSPLVRALKNRDSISKAINMPAVAEVLGVSTRTVRSRIKKARQTPLGDCVIVSCYAGYYTERDYYKIMDIELGLEKRINEMQIELDAIRETRQKIKENANKGK